MCEVNFVVSSITMYNMWCMYCIKMTIVQFMDETTRFTSHMCHDSWLFVLKKSCYLVLYWHLFQPHLLWSEAPNDYLLILWTIVKRMTYSTLRSSFSLEDIVALILEYNLHPITNIQKTSIHKLQKMMLNLMASAMLSDIYVHFEVQAQCIFFIVNSCSWIIMFDNSFSCLGAWVEICLLLPNPLMNTLCNPIHNWNKLEKCTSKWCKL
jgi:hypothetical protein